MEIVIAPSHETQFHEEEEEEEVEQQGKLKNQFAFATSECSIEIEKSSHVQDVNFSVQSFSN